MAPIIWDNQGLEEVGRRADNNKIVIRIDKRYYRPAEVDLLKGDPHKSLQKTWMGTKNKSRRISFRNDRIR